MKYLFAAALACVALAPAAASDSPFKVGDRVLIGSVHEQGTVIEVGQSLADGGTMIKVHLDRLSAAFPNVGAWYDTKMSQVSVTGTATPSVTRPAGVPGSGPQQRTGRVTAPPTRPVATLLPPPAGAAPSAAFCQQLIRANYPPGDSDQTISVNFLAFQMGGAQAHEAVYANDNNGRGHSVTAWPIHSRYTVLTHFADPLADDQLRTYDANYLCYRLPVGGWVVEMTSRAPGGETAQYIHKAR